MKRQLSADLSGMVPRVIPCSPGGSILGNLFAHPGFSKGCGKDKADKEQSGLDIQGESEAVGEVLYAGEDIRARYPANGTCGKDRAVDLSDMFRPELVGNKGGHGSQ